MDNKIGLLLLISVLFFGCFVNDDEDDCKRPMHTENIDLKDRDGHWFEKVAPDHTLTASSNKGRSESFDISNRNFLRYKESLDCISYYSINRRVIYESSLYERYYECIIENNLTDDILSIKAGGYDEKCELNIQYPQSCIVTYTNPKTLQVTLPVVIVDSMPMNNYMFRRTYKIDFKDPDYSLDGKTKILYLNSQYGIVKFETFEGEVWSLY